MAGVPVVAPGTRDGAGTEAQSVEVSASLAWSLESVEKLRG